MSKLTLKHYFEKGQESVLDDASLHTIYQSFLKKRSTSSLLRFSSVFRVRVVAYSSLFVILVGGIYGPFLMYNQHQSLVIRDFDLAEVANNAQVQAGFVGTILKANGDYQITDSQNQAIIGSSLYAGDKITLNDGAVFNFSLAQEGNASIQGPAVFILHKQAAHQKDQKDTYTIQLLEGTYAHVSSQNNQSLIALESPEMTISQNAPMLDIQLSSAGTRSVLTNKGGRVTIVNTTSKIAKTLESNQIAHVSPQDFEIIKTPEQAKTLAKVLQEKSFTKTYDGDEKYNKEILAVVNQLAAENTQGESSELTTLALSSPQENGDQSNGDQSVPVAIALNTPVSNSEDLTFASKSMTPPQISEGMSSPSQESLMMGSTVSDIQDAQKVPSKEQVLALEKQLYPDFVMKQVKDLVTAHLQGQQNAYSIAANNIAGLLNNLSNAFGLDTKIALPVKSLQTLSLRIDDLSLEIQRKYYIPSRSVNNLSALKNWIDALAQQQFGSVDPDQFDQKNLYERLNIQSSSLYLMR